MNSLFDHARDQQLAQEAPLAARMRPRTLDEFIGQEHIVGPGRLLRRAIRADQLASLIFHGPPGTGKTTLARIIANSTQAHFIALNAVLSGVKDIRAAISTAQERRGMYQQKTILFIDEVHRFNKAQQDALLPHVENGTVILIGATTENPYFEVNKALVSRSRIFQLRPLTNEAVQAIIKQALADEERGYGQRPVMLRAAALAHLVNVANGDARAALNALELAVETTPPQQHGEQANQIEITLAVAEESIQQRAILYDKDGDAHFDTISAFIKSLRGSDPDAALYWMARMIYAGESPRFILRRMLIFASEDVGLADPQALSVVTAAAQAFDYVGLPEGRFHLAEACLYLATAPKSNSAFAFWDALAAVEQEREADVPSHLKDANRDSEDFGHGKGYLYPHAYRDHWVAQQYLPQTLQGRVFYQPSKQGYEATIEEQVARQREAQLAAMLETERSLLSAVEQLPAGPPTQNRWLQRTLSGLGAQLSQIRERVFALAEVKRHSLLLDVRAGTGLLTWEAVRRAPVGGVYALAEDEQTAQALRQQAEHLEAVARPTILTGNLANAGEELPPFEIIMGRNLLTRQTDKLAMAKQLRQAMALGGRVVLAEVVPRQTQRLYNLVDLSGMSASLRERLIAAEEAIYQAEEDPMTNWEAATLQRIFEAAEFAAVQVMSERLTAERQIEAEHLARWFERGSNQQHGGRLSYAAQLQRGGLSEAELTLVQAQFERQLAGQLLPWETGICYVVAQT